MSGQRNRVIYRKEPIGKENIFVSKQSNKLVSTNSQKILSRKRSLSADLDLVGTCNCGIRNDAAFNEIRSSAKKTPFQIHFDRAGNDLVKGVRFRERIIEYDTRRMEKFKRNIQDFQSKYESTHGTSSLVKKQQKESNPLQGPSQNYKESRAISRNSIISGSKPIFKSIVTISQADIPKLKISTAKSLIDLSRVNVDKKQSLSSSSVIKSNNLEVDDYNRVHLRSRSCSNRPSTTQTRNRVFSTNEVLINIEKEEIEPDKCKKLGGSKDSLVSGPSAVLSSNSSKKQFAGTVEKVSINSKQQATPSNTDQKSDDQKKQPLTNAILEKVQAKVESNLQGVRQNSDFSAYLLYDSDYLADLLTIEKEKETTSPQLSPKFIDKYINSESRKVVVAFLIRLSTRCRYPSFILYQAVKIFDAIIDRTSIEEPDSLLVAVTALWIVLKKDGNFNKIPSAKSMLEIAQGTPSVDTRTLIEWERQILRILDFNVTFSDPFSIFVFYVINYDYDPNDSNGIITKIYYCGGYIIDLTLLDAKFSYMTSNHLALTTAELVMSVILDDEANLSSPRWHYWRSVITNGVYVPISYYDKEINLLRSTMINCILQSAKKYTKEEVVRKRYSHNRYGNISGYFLNKIMKLPPKEYSICM